MSGVSGIALAAVAFLLIPVAQWLDTKNQPSVVEIDTASLPPPPPPLLEEIDEPEPEEDEKPPEIKEQREPPSIEALELALNPDISGMITGSGSMIAFEIDQTELTDLVFDISDLDERPSTITTVAPVYPDAMRRAGVGGRVIVEFRVDREGNVRDPVVIESPNPAFDRPSLDAVRRWKFTIGRKNGRPVEFRMRLPLQFGTD